jgi:hypothetical protein
MEDRKNLIRIANRIQDDLMKLKNSRYLELMRRLTSFAGQFQELTAESRKMGASLAHGWFSAAERCCSRTSRLLNDISYSISQIQQVAEGPQKKTPKLSLLVEELNQVWEEFGNVDFDKGENTISVVTDPITLDDVALGPFRIQLELGKLNELYKDRPYRLIALDPNPAATDEEVTHPHVSSERLCEGDGCVSIRASLEQGRLSDFFTMVRSILNTYNPDSPYVALYDWNGEPCYDCGYVMSREDTYYCSFCDHDYCEQCTTYCRCCDETCCSACSQQCPHCEENACMNCMKECAGCGSLCCESCFEEDICPNCKLEMENENEEQECQIDKTSPTENREQAQASKTEIKLAS